MDLVADPIPRLIRKIAFPASVGFFFNTMYNVVDTYFAGLISTEGLAALSLSFPIFFVLIAVGTGVSQGATALISNALGEDDSDEACRYFFQSVSFGVFLAIGLTIVGLVITPRLFTMLSASGTYLQLCLDYMNIILLGTIFILLQSIINAALNAQGNTTTFRNVLIVGFVMNCILDPWLMLGGLGVPALGIKGVALATIIIQFVGGIHLIMAMKKSKLWNGWHWSALIPQKRHFIDIAKQGFPASINMMSVALGIFVITWFISCFSTAGVAAYGIATRVEQIILLPTIGLNIAVLTLTSQNNGAKRWDRVREIWIKSVTYGMAMMIAGGIILFGLREPLMRFFTEDREVITIGTDYLKIAAITLCSYVILFQTVFMLQGLKRPMYAIWIGIYRQILAPCLIFYLLAFVLNWKLFGIWWGIFFVTWSAGIVTWLYGRWTLNRIAQA
ncbi:MAG: Multidrug export protein MepA [Verrucomicrobia subdivision 3 bacterium]|nr:Multidrug export protein MepA [Limisphaerales bacterium]MCS1415287.1 Multidrug export protein MepA [Limisphaerales bacterium]